MNTPAVRDRDRKADRKAEAEVYEPRDPTEPLPPIEPAAIYPVDPNIVLDEEGSAAYAYGRAVNEEDDESRRESRRSSRDRSE